MHIMGGRLITIKYTILATKHLKIQIQIQGLGPAAYQVLVCYSVAATLYFSYKQHI